MQRTIQTGGQETGSGSKRRLSPTPGAGAAATAAVKDETEEEEGGTAAEGSKGLQQKLTDESIVTALVRMGFSREACRRAAIATNNKGSEAAMEWLFTHESDPDINDPLPGDEEEESEDVVAGKNQTRN